MRSLTETHAGMPPVPVIPEGRRIAGAGDDPPSRVGARLLDLADQPVSFPSDRFARGTQTLTRDEWLRRHAKTYGEAVA